MGQEILAFKKILLHLRKRRGMYITDPSYSALTIFISGYLLAIRDLSGTDLADAFRSWLKVKENNSFAISSFGYIFTEMANRDEAVAENILFENLDEFIDAQ